MGDDVDAIVADVLEALRAGAASWAGITTLTLFSADVMDHCRDVTGMADYGRVADLIRRLPSGDGQISGQIGGTVLG